MPLHHRRHLVPLRRPFGRRRRRPNPGRPICVAESGSLGVGPVVLRAHIRRDVEELPTSRQDQQGEKDCVSTHDRAS